MIGRLGMTGSSVTRGDREVYKAMATSLGEAALKGPKPKATHTAMGMPKKVAIGAGVAAGVAGVGYSASPSGRRMAREAKAGGLLQRSGNAQFRSLDRAGRRKMTSDLVDRIDAQRAVAKSGQKRDYSGAAVGSGSVVGAVGLAGGGIPGVKSKHIMVDVKGAKGVKAKTTKLAGAYRGGEFGYRHNAHHTFKTFGLGGDAPKKATRVEHFTQGDKAGRVVAEDKIIQHLKVGRRASNVALIGGTALAGAGIHQRRKRVVEKRDDFKADVTTAAGATTALTAGGVSRVLNSQGRKWSKRSAINHDTAEMLNPRLGGYDVKRTKTKVPDVVPHRSKMKNTNQAKTVFAGRSNKSAQAAGALKGEASQGRYFAATYGAAAKIARKVAIGGAAVGAVGLGAKAVNAKRHEVTKADDLAARRAAKATKKITLATRKATVETNYPIARLPRWESPARPLPPKMSTSTKVQAALGAAAIIGGGATIAHTSSRGYKSRQRRELGQVRARKAVLQEMAKAETTMSDEAAAKLAGKYDTRGPLPKGMDRATKMKAYEARYIHSGGKKGERYKRKAAVAEVGRTAGLATATISAAGILAHRGKKTGKILSKVPRLSSHNLEAAGLAGAAGGGSSEMYGAYARHRRASYANSPAGVAGSALTRMQAYTPKPKSTGAKT